MEFSKEITIKGIDGSSEHGFSGMLVIRDKTGRAVLRKGIWGWTDSAVETEAAKLYAEFISK